MSLAPEVKRSHALAFVRRSVLETNYKTADVDRWAEELGEEVYAVVAEAERDRDAAAANEKTNREIVAERERAKVSTTTEE